MKAYATAAGIALAAYAVVALIQRKVKPIPVVGEFLPR